jgi:all-trans-retinol 13,14-reductase
LLLPFTDTIETYYIGDPPVEYTMTKGKDAWKRDLLNHFPEEKEAIDKYFKAMKTVERKFERACVFKSMPLPLSSLLTRTGMYKLMDGGYHKAVKYSLEEKLNKWTKNKDLQAVLAASFPDYGTEPCRAPFLFQPAVANSYINGAYYPRGGASAIPEKVIKAITGDGGRVFVSAKVERIVVDEETGKAKGVKMEDGTVLESSVVISDAGLINTATRLLPHGLVDIKFADVDGAEDQLHPAATGVIIFVGLEGDAESRNLANGVGGFIHASNDMSATAEKLRGLSLDEALELDPKELSPIGVSVASAKDSTWNERYPDKTAMEIIAWLPWSWFEKFQFEYDEKTKSYGAEYEAAKERLAEKIWERVSVEALRRLILSVVSLPSLNP